MNFEGPVRVFTNKDTRGFTFILLPTIHRVSCADTAYPYPSLPRARVRTAYRDILGRKYSKASWFFPAVWQPSFPGTRLPTWAAT
jgi:hypothetical protein